MYLCVCVFVAFFERELYHEGAIDLPQPNPVTDHKQPQLCDGVKDLIGGEDESQCREISQLHTHALARTHSRTHARTHTLTSEVSLLGPSSPPWDRLCTAELLSHQPVLAACLCGALERRLGQSFL